MTRKSASMALLLSLTWPPVITGEKEPQSQAADGAEAQPPAAKVEAHGDWALQCPETSPCFLVQRVFSKDSKEKPLVSFALQFSGKPSRLLIALQTPLDVMLAPGIEFGVDKRKATTYPFHHCRLEGCLAIFPVSQQLRKNLKAGERVNIGYSLTNGKKYGIPVSLKGITAGLQALKKAVKDAKKDN